MCIYVTCCFVCLQVLHLVGMALLEEQQQLENSSGEDHVTFNYTSRIICRQTHTGMHTYTHAVVCEAAFTLTGSVVV